MRRIFEERARLVIYLELEDLNGLTAKARESGKTVVEWAREKLLGANGDNQSVRQGIKVPLDVRSALPVERTAESKPDYGKPVKGCPHGVQVGWRCTLCGGVVK